LNSEENSTSTVFERRFKEFLTSQVKKSPVTMVEDQVVWEEPRGFAEEGSATGETGQRSLHAVFAEGEVLDSITLSKAEAELLRRQIRDLDLRLGELSRWNKVLRLVVIALCCLTVVMAVARFVRAW